MKKLLLTLVVLMFVAVASASAEELSLLQGLQKLSWKQGVAYSMVDSKVNYLSTIELMEKWGATLEVGYAGSAPETRHKLVGVISYPVLELKDWINIPLLDLMELNLGVYGGMGQICLQDLFQNDDSNEKDWGVSATLIEVKW